MTKIKLFCFSYAGGSSGVFNTWGQYLHPDIALMPVELAGRGRRMGEPLYQDVASLMEDVYDMVFPQLDGSDYALFGHSMGAMITYNLARKIKEQRLSPPLHLFFSGRGAPHLPDTGKQYHLMDDTLFREEVLALGGTPPELFQHPELIELFLPVLKNDFMLVETEPPVFVARPLDAGITIFAGKEDSLTQEQTEGWRQHTRSYCAIHYFDGGHFFLHQETAKLVHLINHTLMS